MASIRSFTRTARLATSAPRITAPSTSAPSLWRLASSAAAAAPKTTKATTVPEFDDLEQDSSLLTPLPESVKMPVPEQRSGRRLPGSRYQFHPPKYDRGPLHPIQSPASSDPTARDFVPGPFNNPRLRQTYNSTLASDIMALTYVHSPPGAKKEAAKEEKPDRLRGWDGSSPYHKNRPLRGPRGSPYLSLIEHDITFRNIPQLRSVTIAAFVPDAIREPDRLVVARACLQSITGASPETTKVKRNVSQWHIVKGQKAGAKVTLYGNEAYEFLDKCVHLVFPRIKEWKGVKGSTGDSSGNLSWGLTTSDMALFPEIESNYGMYPPKMIPGCRIFVETTARSDRHARLLMSSMGVPFYGELRN